MGPLGWQETVFIFILALLIFGPKKLPELGKTFGKAMSEFRRASAELKATWSREMAAIERESQEIRDTTRQVSQEITSSYNYGYDGYDYDFNYNYGYNYDTSSGSSAAAAGSSSGSAGASAVGPSTPSASPPQSVDTAEGAGNNETAQAASRPSESDTKPVTS